MENYGERYHKHRNCQEIRNDEHFQWRETKNIVTKKMSRYKAQLSQRNEKVLQQNPSSKQDNIIPIVNTDFNLIMNEQGQGQPISLFTGLGINIDNEQK